MRGRTAPFAVGDGCRGAWERGERGRVERSRGVSRGPSRRGRRSRARHRRRAHRRARHRGRRELDARRARHGHHGGHEAPRFERAPRSDNVDVRPARLLTRRGQNLDGGPMPGRGPAKHAESFVFCVPLLELAPRGPLGTVSGGERRGLSERPREGAYHRAQGVEGGRAGGKGDRLPRRPSGPVWRV